MPLLQTNKKRRPTPEPRGLLPPLSVATLLGIVLFMAYIGSALLSALPFSRKPAFGGVGALYSPAEEAQYCSSQHPMGDPCFTNNYNTNKTIYMQPYGGLGNRIRAVASALSIAQEVKANVVIVWTEKEHGFRGHWNELFASPSIPLGCFPGSAVREDNAKCTVHRINHKNEWDAIKNTFETRSNGQQVLCLQSMMFLTEKQRDIGWFYSLLRPAAPIASAIHDFQKTVEWDGWGQWVGVHIRRTDLRLLCNTDDCRDGLSIDVLPLENYTTILHQIAELGKISGDKPRFFLATDDPKTESIVRYTLEQTSNLTQSNGRVISYSKTIRDISKDSLAMRSSTAGTAEALVDLWLLSRTQLLVGTTGSSYSQTAKLMGKNFFMTVGVEYENKL